MTDLAGKPSAPTARPVAKVLAGQKALVTGANSGIGRAITLALGQAGADVVVNHVAGDAEAARRSSTRSAPAAAAPTRTRPTSCKRTRSMRWPRAWSASSEQSIS